MMKMDSKMQGGMNGNAPTSEMKARMAQCRTMKMPAMPDKDHKP